ncbi:glycine-rich domain-containing protein [Roseibium sp.]|uniref:glycine-rich domain-containing protein n=1 Tax=Roseibium sp. TaxID=1936156 RepID=UPI003B50E6C4
MTSLNTQLWELIKTHKMPDDAAGTPFTKQLMAENRISLDTATVAIAEYQKFMYLCATRPERNVPSKAVDLVWHLHMQHSRDYWDIFCKKLGKPVHHNPGANGPDHLDDYKATIKAYKDLFGMPPKGIWKLNDKIGVFVALIFSAVFICIGVVSIADGGNLLFWMFWLGISLLIFGSTLNYLTTKGEFTLIFESNDPFSDKDAGDCGSGDGGGCGD